MSMFQIRKALCMPSDRRGLTHAGGGSAVVYRGVDVQGRRDVALKVITARWSQATAHGIVFVMLIAVKTMLQVMYAHSEQISLPVQAFQREVRLAVLYSMPL